MPKPITPIVGCDVFQKNLYRISVSFSTDTKSIELCRQILIKAMHEISEIALKSIPESVHHNDRFFPME